MATDYIKEVQKLYVAYFSRPADPDGLAYWASVLQSNPTGYQTMSANFAASAEFRAVYNGMDNRAIVAEVYDNLFGRAPEAAGLDYWVGELNAGRTTIDNVVTQVANGSQNLDRTIYNGKVSIAETFTSLIDTDAEKAAYRGEAANKIAIDYLAQVNTFEEIAMYRDPGPINTTIARIVGTPSAIGFDDAAIA